MAKTQRYTCQDGTVSEYRYDTEGPVWESHRPRRICAMCDSEDAPVTQIRKTGTGGKPQVWHFCRECWDRYYGAGQSARPEVIEREAQINFASGRGAWIS